MIYVILVGMSGCSGHEGVNSDVWMFWPMTVGVNTDFCNINRNVWMFWPMKHRFM